MLHGRDRFSVFILRSQPKGTGRGLDEEASIPTLVLSLGIGMAVNNAKATLEALMGHQSPFVRTPKLAVEGKSGPKKNLGSYRGGRSLLPYFELALALCYIDAALYCLEKGLWFALPFMMLFLVGFLYTGLMGLFQWPLASNPRKKTGKRRAAAA